jgi:hypothetical protein
VRPIFSFVFLLADLKNDRWTWRRVRLVFRVVYLQPSGEFNFADEELVEANGSDIEHGADQEGVDVLYNLYHERELLGVRVNLHETRGDANTLDQQLNQANAAKDKKAAAAKPRPMMGMMMR